MSGFSAHIYESFFLQSSATCQSWYFCHVYQIYQVHFLYRILVSLTLH